jgi:hypothetical protein
MSSEYWDCKRKPSGMNPRGRIVRVSFAKAAADWSAQCRPGLRWALPAGLASAIRRATKFCNAVSGISHTQAGFARARPENEPISHSLAIASRPSRSEGHILNVGGGRRHGAMLPPKLVSNVVRQGAPRKFCIPRLLLVWRFRLPYRKSRYPRGAPRLPSWFHYQKRQSQASGTILCISARSSPARAIICVTWPP